MREYIGDIIGGISLAGMIAIMMIVPRLIF
jgi:hypothetical protein